MQESCVVKIETLQEQVDEVKNDIEKFFQLGQERQTIYTELRSDFHKHKIEVDESHKRYKQEVNNKLIE